MDLATGQIDTARSDGSVVPWLSKVGNPQDWAPALGLTADGRVLIGGNGAFVEYVGTDAIIWHPVHPIVSNQMSANNFKVVGLFDPLGRRIVNSSFSSGISSGNYFTVIRQDGKNKVVKNPIVK